MRCTGRRPHAAFFALSRGVKKYSARHSTSPLRPLRPPGRLLSPAPRASRGVAVRTKCYARHNSAYFRRAGRGDGGESMEIIENQRFGEERALYHRRGLTLRGCRFAGEEDGESALKECADVAAENCLFDLRYPLWHVEKLRAERCTMTENCRAALWYGSEIRLIGCTLGGIKAVRECRAVALEDCTVPLPRVRLAVRRAAPRPLRGRGGGVRLFRDARAARRRHDLRRQIFLPIYAGRSHRPFRVAHQGRLLARQRRHRHRLGALRRVPRLVFGRAHPHPLPHPRHPAAVLLQGAAARRLHDGGLRPRL